MGELGEGGVRFASTPLRPNLSTSRLHTSRSASRFRYAQGLNKRCRLSWLTNSALVYEPKCG